jgi:hypothetical protein
MGILLGEEEFVGGCTPVATRQIGAASMELEQLPDRFAFARWRQPKRRWRGRTTGTRQ